MKTGNTINFLEICRISLYNSFHWMSIHYYSFLIVIQQKKYYIMYIKKMGEKMKKKYLITLIMMCMLAFSLHYTYSASDDDWLHTQGNKILDKNNNQIRITGINWFGFDTSQCVFHGLWSRDLKSMLDQVAGLGFNAIRVPLHAELVSKWSQGIAVPASGVTIITSGSSLINDYLAGLDSSGILDYTVNYCGQIGLKLILDMHCIQPDSNEQNLWYNASCTLENFINDWKFLAERYKNTDTVIGVDLKNEPHGLILEEGAGAAKWDGTEDANNWKRAAEKIGQAVLSVNSNLLIFVEGVQQYYDQQTTSLYEKLGLPIPADTDPALHVGWWGGNLMGVKNFPVHLGSSQDKLVYAPHEYGPNVYMHPWFFDGFNRDTMEIVWDHFWNFINENNSTPVLIGEWGGKISGAENAANLVWMTALRDKIVEMNWSHTFWCLNENSTDTGGIITGSNWDSINQAKYDFIRSTLWQDGAGNFIGIDHQINLGLRWRNAGEYYNSQQTSTPAVSATPTPSGVRKGDVNRDGTVTIVDALMTAQYYVGLNPPGFYAGAADVNDDGVINIIDALMIAQYYVGLITF